MTHVLYLQCLICGNRYAPTDVDYLCPAHGNEGILDVVYDYEQVSEAFSIIPLTERKEKTMWRYKPLLPIAGTQPTPPLTIGGTPLYFAPRLTKSLGLRHVWVKDDSRNPTASFKDRASGIAVMKAQERGAQIITTASTGNAAAALAGVCASVGMKSVIFVPATAPQAKIAQLLAFGATVLLVDGSYDQAFELCTQSATEFGWYNRNTGFNPYMTEGKKTVSFEIWEQMGRIPPDVVFVSVGDGCIIGGVHKGFKDLLALGWIDRLPRLIGVQSAGSNYLASAWEQDEDVLTKPAIETNTLADSISAGLPRDRLKAMNAVKQTGGVYMTVSDEQILSAIPTMAQGCGVFAEPAGAAAYAGLIKAVAQDLISPDERVVVINTGSGLKDVAGVMQGVANAGIRSHHIQPNDLAHVKRVLNGVNAGIP